MKSVSLNILCGGLYMFNSHIKMMSDPIELYEARLLEMPYKNGKIDFHNVDFKTFYRTHREIKKAHKLARKIIKFNKI